MKTSHLINYHKKHFEPRRIYSERQARHNETRRRERLEHIQGLAGITALLILWILAGIVDAI